MEAESPEFVPRQSLGTRKNLPISRYEKNPEVICVFASNPPGIIKRAQCTKKVL